MTEKGIELYQGLTTPPVFWPYLLGLRARVAGACGDPERGLELIGEAIAIVGLNDVEYRIVEGDLLRMLPDPDHEAVEQAYLSAARVAGAVGIHLVELQALTRLVALRRELGMSPDGTEELAAVYAGFTEGFEERDLVEARAVLAGTSSPAS
jgi:hypothetical protein